jgi:hypothetical protein
MSELEELNRELAEIQDRLAALADDAFAERYELQVRRDRLRERAAHFHEEADAGRSDQELLDELAAHRARLAAIYDQRIDFAKMTGGSMGGGTGSWSGPDAGANRRIAAAQGANEIQARISRIEQKLTERGIDLPEEPV